MGPVTIWPVLGNLGIWFAVCILKLIQLEDNLIFLKMEDDLLLSWEDNLLFSWEDNLDYFQMKDKRKENKQMKIKTMVVAQDKLVMTISPKVDIG